MSALGRMPTIAAIAGVGSSLAVVLGSQTVRRSLAERLGLSYSSGIWRALLVFLLLLNLKSLPFAWHIRLSRIFTYQLFLRTPKPVPPSALFSPVIITSRTPLLELDYNGHKSNSTYFSDLDMARSHLVTCILRNSIRGTSRYHRERKAKGISEDEFNWASTVSGSASGTTTPGVAGKRIPGVEPRIPGVDPPAPQVLPKGHFNIALGAVSCHFRREIPPYVKYEMWTRILSFDRKWLYMVTYFVKPGIIPRSYAIGERPRTREAAKWDALSEDQKRAKCKSAIYATAIGKYVIKKGRLTIPPEIVLMRSDMLPPRPAHIPPTFSPSVSGASTPAFPVTPAAVEVEHDIFSSGIMPGQGSGGEEWTWATMERERQRGMKIVQAFAVLDELHDGFDGGAERGAIGQFDSILGV